MWFLVALIAAAGVLIAAGLTTDQGGTGRGFAGLRADIQMVWRKILRRDQNAAAQMSRDDERVATAKPVETTMDDFFSATVEKGSGYLRADDITHQLERAADVVRASTVRHS